jgi:hypothetical protein
MATSAGRGRAFRAGRQEVSGVSCARRRPILDARGPVVRPNRRCTGDGGAGASRASSHDKGEVVEPSVWSLPKPLRSSSSVAALALLALSCVLAAVLAPTTVPTTPRGACASTGGAQLVGFEPPVPTPGAVLDVRAGRLSPVRAPAYEGARAGLATYRGRGKIGFARVVTKVSWQAGDEVWIGGAFYFPRRVPVLPAEQRRPAALGQLRPRPGAHRPRRLDRLALRRSTTRHRRTAATRDYTVLVVGERVPKSVGCGWSFTSDWGRRAIRP